MKLIITAMNRSFLMIVSVILIVLYGGVSAYDMERDFLPSMNNSTLMVSVRADQYQADQVKAKITGQIEKAVQSINGVEYMESNSFNGGLLCSLYFPLNYDMERAQGEINQALAGLTLPIGVEKPLVTRVSTSSFPIMRVGLTSATANITENRLRTSVQNDIARQLASVPGVADVHVTGGGNNGYEVTVRMRDLAKYGLTLEDVQRSIRSITPPGTQGRIISNQVLIPIQLGSKGISAESIKNAFIKNPEGKTLRLSDVADFNNTIVDLQTISRTDGKPSVILEVLKTPTASITTVSEQVNERLHGISAIKSGDIQSTVLLDQGKVVKDSINSLLKEGVFGCLFSMVSVFVFLRNVRATVLVAISLPISLLASIAFLKWMGISFNILTVSGLVVAMGRVVDDSIVVIDNMYRRMQESQKKLSKHSMAASVREMIPAIVSSTATTIVVFIPILLVGGIVQAAFSSFAWTVISALVVSLFVSMLVVPTFAHLCWRNTSGEAPQGKPLAEGFVYWALRKRKTIVWSTLFIFLVTISVGLYLPINFLPTNGSRDIAIKIELPDDSSLASMDAEIRRVEKLLTSDSSQVETFSSSIGSSFIPQFDDVFDDGGGWIGQDNVGNMMVTLKANVDMEQYISSLQAKLRSLRTGAVYTVTNSNIAGDDSKLKVVFTGADRTTLETTAQMVLGKLQLVPGLSVEGANDTEPKYQLMVNEEAVQRLGVSLDKVLEAIKPYEGDGIRVTLTTDQSTIPVIIKTDKLNVPPGGGDLLVSLGEQTLQAEDGSKVSLKQLVTVQQNNAPSVIRERDGQPFTEISADITSKDIEKVTSQTQAVIEGLSLPPGVHYSFGGITQQVGQMIVEMGIALTSSIVLILMIISAVFRGWKAPLSVLICIPFAVIGSVWGLVLSGREWNLAALIGVMMLTGIVVTNGIVLVDRIECNKAKGMTIRDAIIKGTLSRVRPVLMTATTTILTVLPLAIMGSRDTVISQTLGIVVVGGMLSSTFISLLVIPIMYEWLHKDKLSLFKVVNETSTTQI